MTAESVRAAQNALWLKLLIVPFFAPLSPLCGLALYSFYHSGGRGDPVTAGFVANADEVMPYFAISELPPGFGGLIVSGILAATMSTTSSGLASLSTAIITDFLLRLNVLRGKGQAERLWWSRVITLFSSIGMVAAAALVSKMGTQIAEISWVVNGLCGGPLLGMFMLGMLTTRADERGALIGITAGSLALCCVMLSQRLCPAGDVSLGPATSSCDGLCCRYPILQQPGRLCLWWFASLGSVVTFVVGWCCSDNLAKHQRWQRRGLVVGFGHPSEVSAAERLELTSSAAAAREGSSGTDDETVPLKDSAR